MRLFNLFPLSMEDLHLEILDRPRLNSSVLHLLYEIAEECITLRNLPFHAKDHLDLLSKVDALSNYVWECLHTGEWKDVDISWRHLYSYSSLFKLLALVCSSENKPNNWALEAIKTCDLGLIMGAPILNGILSQCASIINQYLVQSFKMEEESKYSNSTPCNLSLDFKLNPSKKIDIYDEPSMETFISEIMNKKPAIITGVVDKWPAMQDSRWSIVRELLRSLFNKMLISHFLIRVI